MSQEELGVDVDVAVFCFYNFLLMATRNPQGQGEFAGFLVAINSTTQKEKRIQALQWSHAKALAIATIARRSGVHVGKGVASLCGESDG